MPQSGPFAKPMVCVDPSSRNFDPFAAPCVECYRNVNFETDGFCPYFQSLISCEIVNNCSSYKLFGSGVDLVQAQSVFGDLCSDPGCNTAILGTCFADDPQGGDPCPNLEPCISSSGCNLFNFFLLFPEVASNCPGLNVTNNQTSVDEIQCASSRINLPLGFEFDISHIGNGECDIEYNVPACGFDGGM